MSNYTLDELKGKLRKELVEIAAELNLDTSGNKAALTGRIFKHKPSFKEMIESAPVTKDEDLTISIEEDTPVGVEVNDPYPDQNEETEVETETETETEAETEVEEKIISEDAITPPADEKLAPSNMVAENTAEDILKGWQNTIQGFYRKNTPGIAPARPVRPTAIAKELGIPDAAGVLGTWQAAIISRLRPIRGIAPAPPKTAKDMVQIIKSL